MSDYTKIIEESVKNLLSVFDRLPGKDKGFATTQLMKLINHVNRTDEINKRLVEKKKLVKSGEYDDTLDYLIDVIGLMGFKHEIELNYYLNDEFVQWFKDNALNNPKYQEKNITTNILLSFGESYKFFKMENDRSPNSYDELRNYLITFDDLLSKFAGKQLDSMEVCDD